MADMNQVGHDGGFLKREAPRVLRIEGWDRFSWLRAGFSTRLGGNSSVYAGGETGELNLGWTKEDSAAVVAENRRGFVEEIVGKSGVKLVTMRQVHGAVTCRVRFGEELQTADGKAVVEADGLMTNEKGMLLGVQTADCVPVLLVDTEKRVVAAFHAGWRGTVARIVEQGVGRMEAEFGSETKDLRAAVGPAIGACCFEVGEEVLAAFEGEFGYANDLFPGGRGMWICMRRTGGSFWMQG
jgi:YfiH family protein